MEWMNYNLPNQYHESSRSDDSIGKKLNGIVAIILWTIADMCGNRTHPPTRLCQRYGFEVRGPHQVAIHTHIIYLHILMTIIIDGN